MQTKRGLEKPNSRALSKDNKILDPIVRRKILGTQVIREVRPLLLSCLN